VAEHSLDRDGEQKGAPRMFVRITNVHIVEGGWVEYETAAQRLTLEAGAHAPGRLATWLIRSEEEADAGISIQVWDSLAALHHYERTPWYQTRVVPALERLVVGEYPVMRGEVRFLHDAVRGWLIRRPRW
jgi:heme-degrading monooxygenase HmoA